MSKRSKVISGLLTVFPIILISTAALFYALARKLPNKVFYSYRNNQISSISLLGIIGFCILAMFVITAVCAFAILKRKSKQQSDVQIKKWYKSAIKGAVISLVLTAIGAALYAVNSDWNDRDPKCFEFTDGKHTIVIEEESWLLGGWGTIYQVNDDDTALKLKGFSTDDGYRNQGNYDIKWHDDSADITYDNGNSGRETVTVKFE